MSEPYGPGGTSLTLLERLRADEPDAWRAMVRLYGPLVAGWCARFGLRGPDADDAAQEVFRTAATRLHLFRRDRPGDTFRGWLRAVTRNVALMHHRAQARSPQAEGGTDAQARLQNVTDPADVDGGDADEAGEVDALTRGALELIRGEFEERTWQMFWQTVVDGRSPVDVAADLGATPAAVRKAKSRVLRRLKDHFADLIP